MFLSELWLFHLAGSIFGQCLTEGDDRSVASFDITERETGGFIVF